MKKPVALWRNIGREPFVEESRIRRGRVTKEKDALLQLRNIGKAMRQDFELLNIRTVAQLAKQDADKLYAHIQTLTGSRHDPCVWDTYAAAIHQAKTGEALPWWHFTRIRKARQNEGTFMTRSKRK